MEDKAECGNYRCISLEAHAGKIVFKIIAHCLSHYCKRVGILPEEWSGFRPNRPATNMMFVICRIEELSRTKEFCYVRAIDLIKAFDPAHRTLLWKVLAGFDMPQRVISVIR